MEISMKKYKKILCVADKGKKASMIYNKLLENYQFVTIEDDPDLILVLGGDGFMLHAIHNYMYLNIPFFGINYGTVGFLLNNPNNNELLQRIDEAKFTNIYPLELIATDINGNIIKAFAINEIYLYRKTTQTVAIKVIIDKITRIEKLVGDGVIVATSAGSSAYNFSVGGPILPIGSNILSIYGISAFRPRRWKGALLPNNVTINFEAIDYHKRPVNIVADFNEFPNIIHAEVTQNLHKKIQLLFDPGHSLEDRIIREQFI
jgi:NAD+ kinase